MNNRFMKMFLFIVILACTAIGTDTIYQLGRISGFKDGRYSMCFKTYLEWYTKLGVVNIDKDELSKFCKEKSF